MGAIALGEARGDARPAGRGSRTEPSGSLIGRGKNLLTQANGLQYTKRALMGIIDVASPI
jgi:hypothetical protein